METAIQLSDLPPGNTDNTDLFATIADSLVERGYCILPDALPAHITDALVRCQQSVSKDAFHRAGIGRQTDFQHDSRVRSDEICWIDGVLPEGQLWLGWCEQLRTYLNRHLFMGLFSVESHFACYEPGAFYQRHVDAFVGEGNRVLSMVTYLNDNWQLEDGGELVLFADEHDTEGTAVLPRLGTLVIFLSERFPHEVRPATRKRLSVASWFRLNGSHQGKIDPPR
ncbi:2OG-Fe(II) oxygenase [Alteromonas sp. CYL-A6]|uniref:2OG-Fe(II) oxygenase n=1 Tax=Alteromonas nitratireducens TaxID=3390813 RepID=UPI0034B7EDA2